VYKNVWLQQAEEIYALNLRIAALNSDVEQARHQLQATTEKLEQTNHQLADVRCTSLPRINDTYTRAELYNAVWINTFERTVS